jgi:hypothetical protein
MALISARIDIRLLVPWPSSPRRFSKGIWQSVKAISEIFVDLVPTKSKALLCDNPGVSLGTKKKLSPFIFFEGSV